MHPRRLKVFHQHSFVGLPLGAISGLQAGIARVFVGASVQTGESLRISCNECLLFAIVTMLYAYKKLIARRLMCSHSMVVITFFSGMVLVVFRTPRVAAL